MCLFYLLKWKHCLFILNHNFFKWERIVISYHNWPLGIIITQAWWGLKKLNARFFSSDSFQPSLAWSIEVQDVLKAALVGSDVAEYPHHRTGLVQHREKGVLYSFTVKECHHLISFNTEHLILAVFTKVT